MKLRAVEAERAIKERQKLEDQIANLTQIIQQLTKEKEDHRINLNATISSQTKTIQTLTSQIENLQKGGKILSNQ